MIGPGTELARRRDLFIFYPHAHTHSKIRSCLLLSDWLIIIIIVLLLVNQGFFNRLIVMASLDSISPEEIWDLPTPIIIGCKRKVAERLMFLVRVLDICFFC